MPRISKNENKGKQILEITTQIAAALVKITPSNTIHEKVAIVERAHEMAILILSANSSKEDKNV